MKKNFDFENLILLVGTNPLPQFVIAEYFLKKNENINTIWLIYSEENKDVNQEGTNIQANNLERLIRERWDRHPSLKFPLEKVSLFDVGDFRKINDDMEKKVMKEITYESIHLNYTGGTKSMGICIYWILRNTDRFTQRSFSYLDARNFRLIDDNDGIIAEDLRNEVNLSFEELINLHGFRRKNSDSKIENIEDSLKKFIEIIKKKEIENFYNCLKKENTDYLKNKDKVISCIEKNPVFKSIIESLPDELKIYDFDKNQLVENYNNIRGKTYDYFNGKWLEHYIENFLKKIKKENNNKQICVLRNWEIKKENYNYFQLDVIFLNAYQLISISCTMSSNKGICKKNGFEVVLRTRQIGGDEARAILITFAESFSAKIMQQELIYETGGSKNILVLGIEDLKPEILNKKLKKFLFDD